MAEWHGWVRRWGAIFFRRMGHSRPGSPVPGRALAVTRGACVLEAVAALRRLAEELWAADSWGRETGKVGRLVRFRHSGWCSRWTVAASHANSMVSVDHRTEGLPSSSDDATWAEP